MKNKGFCDKIVTGDFMRLRNVKNKEKIMDESNYLIRDPFPYCGKWKEVFSNNNPIYIEIGMGKGQFIIKNAIMHPENNYIGIEKYDSVIVKALQKIPSDITNLRMIRGDANRIDEMFHKEINHIYLNFSDPWPKVRHHNRRLSSKIFLDKYENIFKSDKVIEMRTDNQDLFEYSLVSFSESNYILNEVNLDLHKEEIPEATTEYEDKFSNKGCPIYYVQCSKK